MKAIRTILRAVSVAALGFLAALSVPGAGVAATRLVVYTTLEADHVAEFKKAFEDDNPEIEIVWIRDSTGVVTAKLVAEKDSPRGDAIWGLAVTSMLLLDKEGLLLPYAPDNLAEIKPSFRDPKIPPAWVGMEAWAAALCFNTIEAARINLPRPSSWYDLLDPAFKGRLVMPHPASSGTGYFHVSAWIQMFGEEKAWQYMDRLHDNIAVYVHSGGKPCRMAAAGEYAVGIAYELAGTSARQKGAPIDTLLMKEGGGWDMDSAGIIRGTRNLDAARRLMDWAASRKANQLYSKFVSQVAIPGIVSPIPFYPPGVAESMIRNDFAWASANRARILAEWQKRYDGKAEKR
ncbi:MAG: putative 2-aminoethylphosphonate ABC transporter substrate-binding protein [Rhodospirillales bacterium]|nr:putative 2-aminoethylphosphonate ABC transporter substrate-binding protein [Rhodospirillales bacterium]